MEIVENRMSDTMRKAVKATLEMWAGLDDWHKGKCYEQARMHLEEWLEEDMKLAENSVN